MPDPPAEMSRRQIDRLGDRLRNDPSAEDIKLYAAYRDSLYVSLEQVAGTISGLRIGQLESRRLKRVESVIGKLRRLPNLKLSRMQDIAGCRLIVANIQNQDEAIELTRLELDVYQVYDRRRHPKPKPRWDVHLPGAGNRGGSLAGVFRPLIAGPSGSAVSPRLSGWTARPGICRHAPAPPPCCPSTDCQ